MRSGPRTWIVPLLLSLLAALAVSSTTAFAQAADPAASEQIEQELHDEEETGEPQDPAEEEKRSSQTQGNVEEIRVTGKATAGTTQAAPEAITSFDQGQLDTLGIANVDTLALNTPSLHVGQFGSQTVVTLRGVGVENLTAVGEPGIGFEVDGVHQGRPSAANTTFYDLEGVSVERGPQGGQGGRQTNGGRIALQSKPPDDQLDLFGDYQYGAYDQFLVRGVANIPILDDRLLMSRITAVYEKRDGYQENALTHVASHAKDDANNLVSRFQLRSLLADEHVELRGIGYYNIRKGNGPARYLLNYEWDPNATGFMEKVIVPRQSWVAIPKGLSPTDPECTSGNPFICRDIPEVLALRVPDCPAGSQDACQSGDPRVSYDDERGVVDNDSKGVTGILNWDLPFFEGSSLWSDMRLGAVGGWLGTSEYNLLDVDNTNAPSSYFEQDRGASQGSVEVFLERPDVDRFQFKVGGFYFRETVDTEFCLDGYDEGTTSDVHGLQDLRNSNWAVYGSAGYRIFDSLRLHGGIRYTEEEKRASQTNTTFNNAPLGQPGNWSGGCGTKYRTLLKSRFNPRILNAFTTDRDETWSKPTPHAGLDWQVTDTSTVAFNYSTGFKAGGFPLGFDPGLELAGVVETVYNAEEVTEFEVSLKNQFLDNRLTANVTLFWTDYDPFQVCQIIGALYRCDSNGQATSRGIELEFTYMPIDGLVFNGHVNYLDATIDRFWLEDPTRRTPTGQFEPTPPPENVSGNRLPKAPEFAGSLGVQYEWDLGRWGRITPRAQAQGQSRTYFRVFNTEQFSQSPFIKMDLSLDWVSEDDRYTIRGFVNNVNDVDVINFLFVGPQLLGAPTSAYYLPPRTWGIRLGVNFTSDLF